MIGDSRGKKHVLGSFCPEIHVLWFCEGPQGDGDRWITRGRPCPCPARVVTAPRFGSSPGGRRIQRDRTIAWPFPPAGSMVRVGARDVCAHRSPEEMGRSEPYRLRDDCPFSHLGVTEARKQTKRFSRSGKPPPHPPQVLVVAWDGTPVSFWEPSPTASASAASCRLQSCIG